MSEENVATSTAYKVVAVIIFVTMSFCFFFPYNRFIPLDRRTTAAICATFCYVTRRFLFPNNVMDVEQAIDFDVLVLLASIMIINYIVVHQSETKMVIDYVQKRIFDDPISGFWLVSFAAFIVSPFLTNDGVCLLFVEPILNAFDCVGTKSNADQGKAIGKLDLRKKDSFYFLIVLACSSNIGSSLTYTGNPQNMIVSQDAIEVMPPYLFLFYMILPALLSWVFTTLWIQRCWMLSRGESTSVALSVNNKKKGTMIQSDDSDSDMNDSYSGSGFTLIAKFRQEKINQRKRGMSITSSHDDAELDGLSMLANSSVSLTSDVSSDMKALKKPNEKSTILKKVAKIIVSPFPYAVMLLMLIMIALIFVDIMSIAGLICVTAVVMTLIVVLGNHWQGLPVFGDPNPDAKPLTAEEKVINTNLFFDELFESIDYTLLIIFLGLFVVVDNVASTGLPATMWNSIVGKKPFGTIGSVAGISCFVLVASQFLGNVAIIQLASPNIEPLDHAQRRYAWAVISFVATVGGNLTITGSAANIIVAEKAAQIDPASGIDFFKHYAVCFWITLSCCVLGALLITGAVSIDNHLRGI